MYFMIVTLNLLWGEFAGTNERRFDLLLHILTSIWVKSRTTNALSRSVEAGRNVAHSLW